LHNNCIHDYELVKAAEYEEDDNQKILTTRLCFYCRKCLQLRAITESYER